MSDIYTKGKKINCPKCGGVRIDAYRDSTHMYLKCDNCGWILHEAELRPAEKQQESNQNTEDFRHHIEREIARERAAFEKGKRHFEADISQVMHRMFPGLVGLGISAVTLGLLVNYLSGFFGH